MPRRFISIWKGSFVDAFLLRMKKKTDPLLNRKIWSRRSSILPEFVNCSVRIYNGKSPVRCKEKLVINLESLLLHGNEDKKEGEEKRRKSQNKTHMAQKQNKAHMARKGNPISKRIIVLLLCIVFITGLCLLLEYQQFLERLQSMLLGRSIRFLFSRLLGWEVPLILGCVVGSIVGSSLHMMDPAGWEGGSSSRVPQSEPSVNHAPDPAEPLAPDPDVYHPLLDDNTRRAELDERAGFHFSELSDQGKNSILDSQVIIERAIEKALLSDGYSPDELNSLSKRNEIRGFLFYPQGKLLSLSKYKKYVEEVSFGTHRSKPYKDLIYAISASKLFLKKVKPLKRWELRRVF